MKKNIDYIERSLEEILWAPAPHAFVTFFIVLIALKGGRYIAGPYSYFLICPKLENTSNVIGENILRILCSMGAFKITLFITIFVYCVFLIFEIIKEIYLSKKYVNEYY